MQKKNIVLCFSSENDFAKKKRPTKQRLGEEKKYCYYGVDVKYQINRT